MSFHKPNVLRNGTEYDRSIKETATIGGFSIEGKGDSHLVRSTILDTNGEALFTVDCYDESLAFVVINIESRMKPRFVRFCKDCGRYDRESDVVEAGSPIDPKTGKIVARYHYLNEHLSEPRVCGDGVTRQCMVESNFYYYFTTRNGRKEIRRDVVSKSSAYGREWRDQLVCWFNNGKRKPTIARKRADSGSTAEHKARPSGLGYGEQPVNARSAHTAERARKAKA